MPRSILLGRPMPQPGEPLFTEEDTFYAIALAEEEQDTCPQCGMPKVWCRNPDNQFAFDVQQETCWATWRIAQRREKNQADGMLDSTMRATQLSARFRPDVAPDLTAGLDLGDVVDGHDQPRGEGGHA